MARFFAFIVLFGLVNEALCLQSSCGAEQEPAGPEAAAGCGCGKLNRAAVEDRTASAHPAVKYSTEANEGTPEAPGDEKSLQSQMVQIPGGEFLMGTDNPGIPPDGEGPQRPVHVDSFYMDIQEVTIRQFQSFVSTTGYVTEAEKFGDSFVFEGILSEAVKRQITQAELPAYSRHMKPDVLVHQEEPRTHCTGVASDSGSRDFVLIPIGSQGAAV